MSDYEKSRDEVEATLRAQVERLREDLKIETAISGVRYREMNRLEAQVISLRSDVGVRDMRVAEVERERDAAFEKLTEVIGRSNDFEVALRRIADTKKGYQDQCWEYAESALAQPAACPHEHRDWDTTDGVRCVKCGATHLDRPDSAQPAATGEGA